MHMRGLVLCAATVTLSITSASATMRIADDRGGQIGRYLEAFTTVRSSGELVIVDGNCLSACTLVLGVVPLERICAALRFGQSLRAHSRRCRLSDIWVVKLPIDMRPV
jgi:hypothetical protein